MSGVILKPILTEKSTYVGREGNRFVFMVDRKADKLDIKAAIKDAFNVDVTKVNTINVMGKAKSRSTKRGFTTGRTNHVKKAIVTVADGQTIDIYENI